MENPNSFEDFTYIPIAGGNTLIPSALVNGRLSNSLPHVGSVPPLERLGSPIAIDVLRDSKKARGEGNDAFGDGLDLMEFEAEDSVNVEVPEWLAVAGVQESNENMQDEPARRVVAPTMERVEHVDVRENDAYIAPNPNKKIEKYKGCG
ncbi:hypothetical protein V6N13_058981 [Hibiscus sabdariffa]